VAECKGEHIQWLHQVLKTKQVSVNFIESKEDGVVVTLALGATKEAGRPQTQLGLTWKLKRMVRCTL
jgi:hypothetical protein